MASFSFNAIKPLDTGKRRKRKARRSPTGVVAVDTADAILAIAQIIDPDAWGSRPVATVDDLQKQVLALTEDVEWLSVVPTTPEGEYRLIGSERHSSQQLVLAPLHADSETTLARRKEALAKARDAVNAYDAILAGQRRTLVVKINPGHKPSYFMSRRGR